MKPARCLLDTSLLIDYGQEIEEGKHGPATRTLERLGRARLYVSPVTVAELLEGAEDPSAAERFLTSYQQLTIGWSAALRCALLQARAARRMGENDAWQVALATHGGLTLVGHDRAFENRPGLTYLDHRKA
jgi:predicted nucleic acid-binding protein